MIEEERWALQGLDESDPDCIRTVDELQRFILQIGFLPLFRNEIPGFSVEEHTSSSGWWTGDVQTDPWEWRKVIAAGEDIAYGKFFDQKAGFISKEWFPAFANYRRDGYDFDARWDDELAGIRSKKIMDLFADDLSDRELYSFEAKQLAGFGKEGEKNFEGEITKLQMQTYLCVRDFRRRKNKKGEEYGWGIAVYCLPEHLWGYGYVTGEYSDDPKESAIKIMAHAKELYPQATPYQLSKVLGFKEVKAAQEKKEIPYPDNLVKALRIDGLSAGSMTADQLAGLEVAIGQLRDKQQKTLRMKYNQHMKNAEIGKVMNRAAGTVGTYHTKAMRKLHWKSISAWYLDGYEVTLRKYFESKGWSYSERFDDDGKAVSGMDYCLRLGISLKHFDALYTAGIKTIVDLVIISGDPAWHRKIRGIGPKSAQDILERLDGLYMGKLLENDDKAGLA